MVALHFGSNLVGFSHLQLSSIFKLSQRVMLDTNSWYIGQELGPTYKWLESLSYLLIQWLTRHFACQQEYLSDYIYLWLFNSSYVYL